MGFLWANFERVIARDERRVGEKANSGSWRDRQKGQLSD